MEVEPSRGKGWASANHTGRSRTRMALTWLKLPDFEISNSKTLLCELAANRVWSWILPEQAEWVHFPQLARSTNKCLLEQGLDNMQHVPMSITKWQMRENISVNDYWILEGFAVVLIFRRMNQGEFLPVSRLGWAY